MRDVKFRAWNYEQKEMYNFEELEELGISLVDIKYSEDVPLFFMQYTGLTDKNGKEIYEWDIVKVADDWDEYGFMAGEKREVYYSKGSFRLKPKENNNGNGHTFDDSLNDIEVVGNIYENPELLEE